jgi:hypothetical protein
VENQIESLKNCAVHAGKAPVRQRRRRAKIEPRGRMLLNQLANDGGRYVHL